MRLAMILLAVSCFYSASAYGGVRNGSFEAVKTMNPNSKIIKRAMKKGWEFATPIVLPKFWRVNPIYPGRLEVVEGMAHTGKYCIKLGGNGHFITTFGQVEKNSVYKCSVWAKGKGVLTLVFYQYGGMPGEPMRGISPAKAPGHIPIKTGPLKDTWTQYTGLYRPAPIVKAVNLALTIQGEGYVDDVKVEKATILDIEIFDEMARMKKSGRYLLIDSQVNITRFMKRLEEAKKNLAEVKLALKDSPLKEKAELVKLMEEKISYLLDKENINRNDYNTATALKGISKRLLKELSFKDISE